MKRWTRLVVLVLAALAVAGIVERAWRPPPAGVAGAEAPDFSLRALDGRELRLSSLRGRVVVLNFWATWCPPCKEEIPDFTAAYSASRGQCVEFLGVAEESGTRDEVAAAASKLGINYPVLVDDDGAVGEAFEIPAYPRTLVVDARGRVRKVFVGITGRQALESALAPLLAETTADCAQL